MKIPNTVFDDGHVSMIYFLLHVRYILRYRRYILLTFDWPWFIKFLNILSDG